MLPSPLTQFLPLGRPVSLPQLTLNARRTRSDVEIYDRNELSLGLTAVSRF